jgi:hypothetical protein
VSDCLSAKQLLELLQDIPEKLTASQRLLAQQLSADPQQNPAASPLRAPAGSPRPGALAATIEGDPASGSFCIRVAPANAGSRSLPPPSAGPGPETEGIAAKVFQLLGALNPDSGMRKAPLITVFLLRFRKNLSRSEIAHECKCGTSLVSLRLRAIQQKLPWRPQQLRELSAQVEAMQDALNDSRARRIYRKGAVYGGQDEEQGLD